MIIYSKGYLAKGYSEKQDKGKNLSLIYRYKKPAVTSAKKDELLAFARQNISPEIMDIKTEYCFYVETKEALSTEEEELLRWLLS